MIFMVRYVKELGVERLCNVVYPNYRMGERYC